MNIKLNWLDGNGNSQYAWHSCTKQKCMLVVAKLWTKKLSKGHPKIKIKMASFIFSHRLSSNMLEYFMGIGRG